MTQNFAQNLIVVLLIGLLLLQSELTLWRRTERERRQEQTFAIIKPEAVAAGKAPDIIKIIKDNGFTILRQKELTLTKEQAEKFYAIHKEKPFFADLIKYITSGPVIVLALERRNAVKVWRDVMGATNPEKAEPGTIRKLFGKDIERNAVHGSDSIRNAKNEIAQFFHAL